MKRLLLLPFAVACLALTPTDVQMSPEPGMTVKADPRNVNTQVLVTVSRQDKVTQNGVQVSPAVSAPAPAASTPSSVVDPPRMPTPPAGPDTSHTDHHVGITVNPDRSLWPVALPGTDRVRLQQAWVNGKWVDAVLPVPATPAASQWQAGGDVRSVCGMAWQDWNDNLVQPGVVGGSHHHTGFGNTMGWRPDMTADNIRALGGRSTCRGGTMNLSAYWAPSLIDTESGVPLAAKLLIYYKKGVARYMGRPDPRGGVEGDWIQPFPKGLSMIFGDAMRSTPGGIATWYCADAGGNALPGTSGSSIPASCPGDVRVHLPAPQCWDGKNLDSPNHKTHMAYPSNNTPALPPGRRFSCPATHPVVLPQVEAIIIYSPKVRTSQLRLSSDVYTGPAGYSAHFDWRNGWEPAVMQALQDNCWKPRRDCGSFQLGDGRGAGAFPEGGNQ